MRLEKTSYSNEKSQFVWNETDYQVLVGPSGQASNQHLLTIIGNDTAQQWDGFGAELTDASAYLFSLLKSKDEGAYNRTVKYLFNQRSGLSIVRVPIGSTDYTREAQLYTLADKMGALNSPNDTEGPLAYFSMDAPKQHMIPFLRDALACNGNLKIALSCWSPPAWMKTNSSTGLQGGTFQSNMSAVLAEYLAKATLGFSSELGVRPWSLSVQNDPLWATSAYPSMLLSTQDNARVLASLKGRLAELDLASVQLMGREESFSQASDVAQLIVANASSIDAVAWHCNHAGGYFSIHLDNVSDRGVVHQAFSPSSPHSTTAHSRLQKSQTRPTT